jgi:hypothetical protein
MNNNIGFKEILGFRSKCIVIYSIRLSSIGRPWHLIHIYIYIGLGPEGELGWLGCAEGKRERKKPGQLGWAAREEKRGRRKKGKRERGKTERDLEWA